MKTAISWIKDALSSRALAPALAHFLVRDGMLYAADGRMIAAHPFPYAGEPFCAPGKSFASLIERLPDPIGIVAGDETVTLRSGRLNGTLKTLDPEEWPYQTTSGRLIELPERMLAGMKLLRPFVSDNAARLFAMCIRLANETLYATNNIVAVAVPEIDLDSIEALVPYWAVDFVLERTEGLTHWSHGYNHIGFHWSNGAWLRTSLVDDKFPEQVETLINQAGFAHHEITVEWRKAFTDMCALIGDTPIVFRSDKMTSLPNGLKDTDIENGYSTLLPLDSDYSSFATQFLEPVIAAATHWAPDKFPKPVPFRGEGIVGVIMGRKI